MMKFEFDDSGLKDFIAKLDQASTTAEELEHNPTVSFDDPFNPHFMVKHTSYDSIDSFLLAAGIDPTSQESFDAFPQKKLDEFVAANSRFFSFQEMHNTAAAKYIFGDLID